MNVSLKRKSCCGGFDLGWEVGWRPIDGVGSVSSAGTARVIAVFLGNNRSSSAQSVSLSCLTFLHCHKSYIFLRSLCFRDVVCCCGSVPEKRACLNPLEHPALSFLCHFAICVVLCLLTSLLPLEKSQLQEWNRKKLNMTLCVHFHVSVGYFYIYYEPLYYTLPSKVLEWGEKEATSHRVCCLW